MKPNQHFVTPCWSYVLEDEAEWLLKEKAPTADLRLNYFAIANAGSLWVKIKSKFMNDKVKILSF